MAINSKENQRHYGKVQDVWDWFVMELLGWRSPLWRCRCLLNLLSSAQLDIWDKVWKDSFEHCLILQQFLRKEGLLTLCCLQRSLYTYRPCQSPLSVIAGQISTCLIPMRFIKAKAATVSGFWAPSKSLSIAQSMQKGWTDEERRIWALVKMLLERNLVPQTLTHLHRRRERQSHVTKLISAEEHMWILPSSARNVNQTN